MLKNEIPGLYLKCMTNARNFFFFKYNKLADRKSACKRSFPCVLNQCNQKHGMSPVYITI